MLKMRHALCIVSFLVLGNAHAQYFIGGGGQVNWSALQPGYCCIYNLALIQPPTTFAIDQYLALYASASAAAGTTFSVSWGNRVDLEPGTPFANSSRMVIGAPGYPPAYFVSYGTLTNNSGADILVYNSLLNAPANGTIINEGHIENYSAFTIDSGGHASNSGTIFSNPTAPTTGLTNNGTFTNTGGIYVDQLGFTNNGNFVNQGSFLAPYSTSWGSLVNNGSFQDYVGISLSGAATTFRNSGGATLHSYHGSEIATNGAQIQNSGVFVLDPSTTFLWLQNTGSLFNTGSVTASAVQVDSNSTITNNGTITFSSAAARIDGTVSGIGTMTLASGLVDLSSTSTIQQSSINITGGQWSTGSGTMSAAISLTGGTLAIGNFDVAPGPNPIPGLATMVGSLNLNGGMVEMVVSASTTRGNGYSAINASSVNLGGTLSASSLGGLPLSAPVGQSYDLISASSITGNFSSVFLPALPLSQKWISGVVNVGGSQVYRIQIQSALLAQSISFPTIPTESLSVGSVSISATASSGLPVNFVANPSSVCVISGSTNVLNLVGVGSCTVTAGQSGNGTYAAASSVSQTFNVAAAINGGGENADVPIPLWALGVLGFGLAGSLMRGRSRPN